jgi:cell shape-determining protein MreC
MELSKRLKELERRIEHLELVAHPPIDWSNKIESLEGAYERLYDLLKSEIMKQ